MAVVFTLHAVYFLWDGHMKIVVLAAEAGQTRCFIAAEVGVAGFALTGEGRHLVQNGSPLPFLFATSKYPPLLNTSEKTRSPVGELPFLRHQHMPASASALQKQQQQRAPRAVRGQGSRGPGAGQGTEGSSAHLSHPCRGPEGTEPSQAQLLKAGWLGIHCWSLAVE